jgi:amino acid transporter
MGNLLFAKKSLEKLIAEAKKSDEHSLKKTLGPFELTALGVGAVIGAGIFVFSGARRALCRAWFNAFLCAVRIGLRLCGTLLR